MKPLIAIEIITDIHHQHLLGLGACEIVPDGVGGYKTGMTWGEWGELPPGAVPPPCYQVSSGPRVEASALFRRLSGFLILAGFCRETGWDMVSSEGVHDAKWLFTRRHQHFPSPLRCHAVGDLAAADDSFPDAEILAKRAARRWIASQPKPETMEGAA